MTVTPSVVITDPAFANGYTVTTPPGGGWLIKANPPTASASIGAAEQAIRARWLQHGEYPHEAIALVDWLRSTGLEVFPPKTRTVGKEDEPYLRWVGVTATNKKKVSGFVNTSSLTINGESKVAAVAHLDGADVRSNGTAAHFFLPNVDGCKKAVETLLKS